MRPLLIVFRFYFEDISDFVMEGIRKTISTNWEDFKVFLWNKETKEVAGRTGKSWGKLSDVFQ